MSNRDNLPDSYLIISRSDATKLGKRLLEAGFVSHVLHQHDFDDAYLFYSFVPRAIQEKEREREREKERERGRERRRAPPPLPAPLSASVRRDAAASDLARFSLLLPHSSPLSLALSLSHSEKGVCVRDRVYRLRKYPRCFVARECVDWIVTNIVTLRGDRDAAEVRADENIYICRESEREGRRERIIPIEPSHSPSLRLLLFLSLSSSPSLTSSPSLQCLGRCMMQKGYIRHVLGHHLFKGCSSLSLFTSAHTRIHTHTHLHALSLTHTHLHAHPPRRRLFVF